jgi:hypothetical protein
MVFLEVIYPTFVVSFSVDWDDFSLRFRVETAPIVPRARRKVII